MIAGQCPETEQLERLLLGKLPDGETKLLSQHLLHCQRCVSIADSMVTRDELTDALAKRPLADVSGDSLQNVIADSEDLADRSEVPDSMAVQLFDLDGNQGSTHVSRGAPSESTQRSDTASATSNEVDKPPLPEVPGFEILDTLGVGGMGVVYLARQTSLNRMVALKMIRAHALFDQETKSRFQIEAESIARLAHPNIISIFEVGEVNGLPYVALEYVSGGSLAEWIRSRTVTSHVAAEIVAKLARAVQYAHDREVIHRDIKPGNVLVDPLTESRPPTDLSRQDPTTLDSLPTKQIDFQPKLTDFGLARLTNLDDRHTRSGAVIGTPAYMAPEQAQGNYQDVGPSVDIYSLGAILYELLTGRPPFRAGTPVDTIRQVIDDDPISLRALNRDVSKDLETVCLKCLHKRPQARYASAADLADDIDRYLSGRPVVARPLSAHLRVARWCRRRPATASLIAASALLLLTVAIGSSIFALRVAHLNQITLKAKQDSDNDRSVAVSAITKLSDALVEDFERRGGTVKHRQHLVDVALSGLEQVTDSDDRVAGASIVRAHLSRSNLHDLTGDLESSRDSLDQAENLANELVKAFPESEEHQYSLALVHEALADFLVSTGSAAKAIPEIERTTEILNRLTERSPQNPDYLRCLLRIRRLMVVVRETLDDLEGVYAECETYLPVADRLRMLTEGREGRREMAKLHRRMQDAANALGDLEVAEGHGNTAVALFAELKEEAPADDIVAPMDYWVVLQSQAAFYADSGRHDEATELTDAAIFGYRDLLKRDPENLLTKFRLAEGLRCQASLGYYLYDYGRVAEASRESVQLFRELTNESPSNHRYKAFVLCATEGALDSATHAGDWQELDRLVKQAVMLYHSLDPQNIDETFDGYYGQIYEVLWQATQRHLNRYDGEPTADGTCNLLCIYSYLDALQGRNELSEPTRADIARTCDQQVTDQHGLFDVIEKMEGRSRYWLGMSLVHEAVTFGLLAEQETDPQKQANHLQRSIAAIKRLGEQYPVVSRDRLYSKAGELHWVMQTELYQHEIAKR